MQTAIFFMSYLLLQALLTTPLSLLRAVPLLLFWLKARLACTPRRRAALTTPPPVEYGALVPNDTIAALLGVTFCTICPLIAPVALLYFATAYIVQKYQAMFVNGEAYQGGGQVSAARRCGATIGAGPPAGAPQGVKQTRVHSNNDASCLPPWAVCGLAISSHLPSCTPPRRQPRCGVLACRPGRACSTSSSSA
jgi:hypothetical protein